MKILFLTGPHAVGKSYFMEQLAANNDFFKFDTGPEMRKMHKESETKMNIGEWVETLEKIYGPLITCELLCKTFESRERESDNIIITGFRQIEGIEYMVEHFQPDDYEILYIDADFDLLKNNYIAREKKNISDDDFKEYLLLEENWGLKILRNYVLNNSSNCNYVRKNNNIDEVTTDIFSKKKILNKKYEGIKND